jgi:hypothetical protein
MGQSIGTPENSAVHVTKVDVLLISPACRWHALYMREEADGELKVTLQICIPFPRADYVAQNGSIRGLAGINADHIGWAYVPVFHSFAGLSFC